MLPPLASWLSKGIIHQSRAPGGHRCSKASGPAILRQNKTACLVTEFRQLGRSWHSLIHAPLILSVRRSPSAPDADNPAVAEMVREGVRKAREKLIDLSMRNSMLNFRHSETSGRHVRIVDEDLEFLVRTLASGKSLDIIPVPPVDQIPSDEDMDTFRAALKAVKEIDPEWLAAEDARRASGNRRRTKDRVAERALRDRVRAQLEMPEWRPAIDPRDALGTLASIHLTIYPQRKSTTPRHRADHTLQTLLFPDRLEPKLSTLHSAARALQEDAGLSALHCAVGFLEWYEPEDAPDPAYTPLVLLPINMEKRITNGEYVFSIAGRDDDETTNVALREKLNVLRSICRNMILTPGSKLTSLVLARA